MNSHDLTIGGYLVVLAGFVTLQIIGLRSKAAVPTIGEILSRVMRTRTGRVGVLVAWAWIGLHFFAQ